MFARFCLSRHYSNHGTKIKTIIDNKLIDQSITVNGYVKAIRRMKKATFIDINDGSTSQKLQVVLGTGTAVEGLEFHCPVTVRGTVRPSSHPKQEIELHADTIQVEGTMSGDTSYPFVTRRQYPADYLRQFLHVRARDDSTAAVLRLRKKTDDSIQRHMDECGFLRVHPPVVTTTSCEGGAEVFVVRGANDNEKDGSFFSGKSYLSMSAQFHLEALASSLTRVYCMNPAFRAEASLGRRHLAEFWMVEAEEAFLRGEEGLEALQDRIEALVKHTVSAVVDNASDDLQILHKEYPNRQEIVNKAISQPFHRIKYSEAISLLNKERGGGGALQSGDDLSREDELLLTQVMDGPVFVTHWPVDIKPFYMARSVSLPGTALCCDLLLPCVGEVVGGSVREHCAVQLAARVPHGQDLEWYVQLRQWAAAPTAGYGLGFERLIQFIIGDINIKDTIPYPRWYQHCQH